MDCGTIFFISMSILNAQQQVLRKYTPRDTEGMSQAELAVCAQKNYAYMKKTGECRECMFVGLNEFRPDFSEKDVRGAFFENLKGMGANFAGSNLQGATLKKSNFIFGSFVGANLENAIFHRAKLGNVCFADARLKNACFSNCEMGKEGMKSSIDRRSARFTRNKVF